LRVPNRIYPKYAMCNRPWHNTLYSPIESAVSVRLATLYVAGIWMACSDGGNTARLCCETYDALAFRSFG